jgi:hypothetical protein
MEAMDRFGVPRRIVSFVMPLGYRFNLDGTTLYLSLAAVCVAQAAGVELTGWQQFTMLLTLMLTSKGVAGVRVRPWSSWPHAGQLRIAARGHHAHSRGRRTDGHGANDDQRNWQLPGPGHRGAVGRATRGRRR